MSIRATVDEYGVVSVYVDGGLTMLMGRRDYDALRRELGLLPLEPEPVTSGGGIVYGIERAAHVR